MKHPKQLLVIVGVLLVAVIAAPAAHGQDVLVESTFDLNDEEWEVYEGELHFPNAIHWSATGGNPDGHVYSGDPGNGSFVFRAPEKFLGDLTCAFNGTISRDLKTDYENNMGLGICGEDDLGRAIRITNYELMDDLNTWVTSVWTLNEGGGWTFFDFNNNPSAATDADIIQVLRKVTRIYINGESVVGHDETTHVDNVRITCCVDEEYPCKADIKWSQPPVEVDQGVINGWDEVSIIDSNSNCWNCPTQSYGDTDCDGYVGSSDAEIFAAAYNTSRGDPNYNPCADFDRDGDVDINDQQIMMTNWNTNPPDDSPLARPILADDWVCMDDRAIKGIHWWGSFKGWTKCVPQDDLPNAFHIGIWTDVPDPDKSDPNTFSHPGMLVWEKLSSCYTWSYAGHDLDPRGIDPDEACFKFDLLLSQDEWFHQDSNDGNGTIYWLSIAALYDGNTPTYAWGWTTRTHFFNDDAARIADVNDDSWPPTIGSLWENGEPIEYPAGTSWDMAFTLTANRKFAEMLYWPTEDPPYDDHNKIIPPYFDVDDNGEVNFTDFATLADFWLAEAQPWPDPNRP